MHNMHTAKTLAAQAPLPATTMATTDTPSTAAAAEVERLRQELESREREIQRLRARHSAVPLGTDRDYVILTPAEYAALKAKVEAAASPDVNADAKGAVDGVIDVDVDPMKEGGAERDARIAALEGKLAEAQSSSEAPSASSPAPAPVGSAGDTEWARRLQLLELESEARLAMAARVYTGYQEEVARLAQQIQAETEATEARHRREVAALRAEIGRLVRAQEAVAAAAARWFQEVGELGRLGVRITKRATALGAPMRGIGWGDLGTEAAEARAALAANRRAAAGGGDVGGGGGAGGGKKRARVSAALVMPGDGSPGLGGDGSQGDQKQQ